MSWERGVWEKKVSQGIHYQNDNYNKRSSRFIPVKRVSNKDKYLTRFDFIKEDLLDYYVENNKDLDFLSFEEDGFIPIEEDFAKLKLFLDSTHNFSGKIVFSRSDDEKNLFTPLTYSELKNSLNNISPSDAYLTIGFLEFQGFKSPLFFIPIVLNKNIIMRDYNREIKFNYFLKAETNNLPNFNGNVLEYMNILDIMGIRVLNKSFIGNFDFKKLIIYNDLNLNQWNNSNRKLVTFFNKDYVFEVNGPDKTIIDLLLKGKSVLYISNSTIKKIVKESLKNINRLILDFNYNLDRFSFFKNIPMDSYEIDNISDLLEKKSFNKRMFDILSKGYSKINLKPYEIQQKRNEFSRYDYDINIPNISKYTLRQIKKFNKEIRVILDDFNLIELLTNYSHDFDMYEKDYMKYMDVLKSIKYNVYKLESLNKKLNEEYGFIIFENLNDPQDLEKDYNQLIDLIETYYEYHNLKNNRIIYFLQKINKGIDKFISQKLKLTKLNINSTLMEYESKLSSLEDIEKKYFESNEFINELQDNQCDELINELNNLKILYSSLLYDTFKINKFYSKYTCFELNNTSFNHNLTFKSLKNHLITFEVNLNNLSKLVKKSSIVKSFISEMIDQGKDMVNITGIFNYNVYNIILNEFYNNYPDIEGQNLDYTVYKKNLVKINKQIEKNKFYQNLNELWGDESKINKNKKYMFQKELFNKRISNKKLGTIKETLTKFKMYIIANKPLFMMDINQFYEYLGNIYDSSFDYVIIDKYYDFEEISQLSLLFRSDKIIYI